MRGVDHYDLRANGGESPASVWQDRRSPVPADEGGLPADAEVVIVGGGLVGVCCAYWLALRGRRPLLLERHSVAAGATGRNSGLVIPTTALPYQDAVSNYGESIARAVRQVALDGAALLAGIIETEGISCAYRPGGLIQLALDEHEAARYAEEIRRGRADGFEASWLDRRDLARHVATVLGDRILGGMFLPGALTNSVALTDGIAAAACRAGAVIRTGCQVTAVKAGTNDVRVETPAGQVRTAAVIVATNAWSGELLPRLRDVIRPVQGQLIATARMPPTFPFAMAAQITESGEYWQQTPDGAIVLGGCRTRWREIPCLYARLPDPAAVLRRMATLASQERALDPTDQDPAATMTAVHAWVDDAAGTADPGWWLKGLALLAAPVLPEFAGRLWRSLGATGEPTGRPVHRAGRGPRAPVAPIVGQT